MNADLYFYNGNNIDSFLFFAKIIVQGISLSKLIDRCRISLISALAYVFVLL